MDLSSPHTPFKQAQIPLPTLVSKKRSAAASRSSSLSGTESPSPFSRSEWQAVNISASHGRQANDKCKTVKGMEQTDEPARDEINVSTAPLNSWKRAKTKAIVFSDVSPHEIIEKPVVSRKRWLSKNDLSVNVHGYTFFSYDEMEAWVMRMPEGSDRIDVWSDIVQQINLFFNAVSSFAARVAKAIRADPSFRKCHWTAEEMDTFLHSIKVYVKAAKLVCNRCEESFNLINREWGVDAEEYIRCRSLVGRTLQLIAGVAKWRDVLDLRTGLLLANPQAVKRIIEGKTFHSRRLFLTSQDWQQCKEDLVPSRKLYVKELYNAGVDLNLGGEICAGRPILPIPITSDKTGPEQSGVFSKEGQCSYGETGTNAPSTTMTTSAHPTTSAATTPTVGHSGNTHRETANTPPPLPSLLPKPVSDDEIPSGKADEYAPRMMPKAAFVEEVDDDDIV